MMHQKRFDDFAFFIRFIPQVGAKPIPISSYHYDLSTR